jgi:2-polyprenyl-6-methoxyphenol hydroxylase-like FAD-dependent oxidoreductase
MFRSRSRLDQDDPAGARQLLRHVYRDVGWRAQELLDAYLAAEDPYFASVSRIRIPSWSRGRVTLIGDAASCVSLFGDGSSSAMEGAATLTASLSAFPHDIQTALARYESVQRSIIRPRQRGVWLASHLLIPRSRLGIRLRNQAVRLIPHRSDLSHPGNRERNHARHERHDGAE